MAAMTLTSEHSLGINGLTSYSSGFSAKGVLMTDDMAARVLEMREQGMGIAQIARALKKGNAYVTQVLKDNDAYGQAYYMTDEEKARIKELRLEGHSAEVIADSLGRSKYAILEQLRKLKLEKRIIRPITVKGDIAEITLTRGKVAIIDAVDVPLVQGRSWYLTGVKTHPYAATRENNQPLTLHRFLMNPPDGMHVDHINGDSLDNRRSNLRLATPQQNSANVRRKVGRAGFHGVIPTKTGKFFAYVQINLGTFDTAEEAARAYDAKATELFGEFAMTNAKRGLFEEEAD